jgi:hypothetical protein
MSRPRVARRGNGERELAWRDFSAWLRVGLACFTWAAIGVILLGYNLFPGRVRLRLGELSPIEVRAPVTAQYVDQEETKALRRYAEGQVMLQYARVDSAVEDARQRAKDMLDALEMVRLRRDLPPHAQRLLKGLPVDALTWVSQASAGDLGLLREQADATLRMVMSREIRESTPDLEAASDQAAGLAEREGIVSGAKVLLAIIVRRSVGPTHQYDAAATKTARAEARQRVEDVVRTIEANHRIVATGERVTAAHLAMLGAVGLSGPRVDYRRIVAVALIALLFVMLFGAQLRHWEPRLFTSSRLLALLALLVVISLVAANLLALALPNVWMLIVPSVALMAAVLLAERVGLLLVVGLSMLAGLTANGGLPAALTALGSGLAALTYLSHIWPVSRLRWIVGAMAVANAALLVALGLFRAQPLSSLAQEIVYVIAYSPGAAAVALGGIFLLQRPFGITTHVGLLELSNPQQPLLRRLQQEAPGTYFASTTVANLADAAAEAVGADALVARVGALYHDVGKLTRPTFFVENQALLGADNVHDSLSSSLSGLIIVSHVKDGVEMARRERLPQEVMGIVEQHHGTTLVSYFYHRALSGARPESVTEEQFRYPGPLPQSKEAALVMLADSVQAAVQSIADPTPQRVQQMVKEVVRERVVEGQLAECDLSFRDVIAVESIMSRILTALLCHARIEYPEPTMTGTGV